jgi:mono/diheme cytochrome c family protein
MRKVLRYGGMLLLVLVLLIIGLASYVRFALPNVGPAPKMQIAITPERVKRGEYLANHVFLCVDCHSTRAWDEFAGPLVPGSLGKGGEVFNEQMGFPGHFYAPNITPYNLGSWTDGEIFRAITTGVRRTGKPIFPVMPYDFFGKADPEDIKAVIAYIRTLPAIRNEVPEPHYNFPMNFVINTIPAKADPSPAPLRDSTLQYGMYLAVACRECHTPFENGKLVEKFFFAGGREFPFPAGIVSSANLTPDNETGIGLWTKDIFMGRFRYYRDSAVVHRKLASPKDFNSPMPWTAICGMDDRDLEAVFAYLKSLKPNRHEIKKLRLADR